LKNKKTYGKSIDKKKELFFFNSLNKFEINVWKYLDKKEFGFVLKTTMNSTRLTLIARSFGVELPMEVHKKIMAGTVEKVPLMLELGNSSIEMLNSPAPHQYPTRPGSGSYHLDYGRVESMARAVKVGALELGAPCARNYAFTRAQVIENPHLATRMFESKLHPTQRRSQQSFDLKTLAIDMERYQSGSNIYIRAAHYTQFDGWWLGGQGRLQCKANLRKFEFQNMWPTLYGKGGWAK